MAELGLTAALTTMLASGAAAGATAGISALTQKKPKLQPKPLMPDPNDPSALDARRKEEERLRATKGRASTVLEDDYADPTAATAYSNDLLGA